MTKVAKSQTIWWLIGPLSVGLLVFLAVVLPGMRRNVAYSQGTPDDVIQSAVAMIKNGDAHRLGDLVYADSKEMRDALSKLGELFKHMQQLSKAVEQRFPEDIARMKQRAAEAAAEGKPDSLIALLQQASGGAGGRRGPTSVQVGPGGAQIRGGDGQNTQSDQLLELVNRLFADPYGWLERNAERITTLKVADDSAAIMLDGEPIIPVVGLPMRLEQEKWYIAFPTQLPPLSQAMPRTKSQWAILVSVIKVLDRTVVEMTTDVTSGRVATLDSLALTARDKALFPAAIAFAAYGKEMEVAYRIERRVKQVQTKQKEWAKAKQELQGSPVSSKLLAAIVRIAPSEIEPMVRANKAPQIDKLSDRDFEDLVAKWFGNAGLGVSLEGDVSAKAIDAVVAAWEATRGNVARVRK